MRDIIQNWLKTSSLWMLHERHNQIDPAQTKAQLGASALEEAREILRAIQRLTGDSSFIDSYKRATADFYNFHGYLSVLVANEPAEVASNRCSIAAPPSRFTSPRRVINSHSSNR
jgi:hypothetical protein